VQIQLPPAALDLSATDPSHAAGSGGLIDLNNIMMPLAYSVGQQTTGFWWRQFTLSRRLLTLHSTTSVLAVTDQPDVGTQWTQTAVSVAERIQIHLSDLYKRFVTLNENLEVTSILS